LFCSLSLSLFSRSFATLSLFSFLTLTSCTESKQ
jgi:hypothetical protein